MNKDKNIAQTIAKSTDKIIKELSGSSNKNKKLVIDNIISFTGASGGVGTSTLIANVAYEITKKGLSVLIIDTNISYPIQHNYFGIKQTLERKDLVTFLMGRSNLGESLISNGEISVLCANNKTVIDSISCDSEVASKNFEEALERARSLFDVVLIDCSKEVQVDIVNTALYRADAIYCIWDENIACIANMEKIRRNLTLMGIESQSKLKVIMNKRTSIHYPKYIFEKLGVSTLSSLPFDTAILESALRGEIFCEKGSSMSRTSAIFCKEIGKITDKILETGGYKE